MLPFISDTICRLNSLNKIILVLGSITCSAVARSALSLSRTLQWVSFSIEINLYLHWNKITKHLQNSDNHKIPPKYLPVCVGPLRVLHQFIWSLIRHSWAFVPFYNYYVQCRHYPICITHGWAAQRSALAKFRKLSSNARLWTQQVRLSHQWQHTNKNAFQ